MITKIVESDKNLKNGLVKLIANEVIDSLSLIQTENKKFIINDTEWFWRNPAGKLRPTVVNSASYISTHFQNNLKKNYGWVLEKTLLEQRIDAYKNFKFSDTLYKLKDDDFIKLLKLLKDNNFKDYGSKSTKYYKNYVENNSNFLYDELKEFKHLFNEIKMHNVNVGLEFETGNIASSFRAIQKLDYLFQNNKIDIGVFVASFNKNDCAGRIWPVSNRVGSFEELKNRHYETQREYPYIDISFMPDSYSKFSKYLGKKGQLYEMTKTGNTLTDVYEYEEYEDNENILKYKKKI